MSLAMEAALSGLRAAQQQLDIASNNVANATTRGYTRKTLPTETLILAGTAHGVLMGAVQRLVDGVLLKDLQVQNSVTQAAQVTQTYLDRILQFNGSSDAASSVSAVVSQLSQSFTALSNTPEDPLSLQKTLTAALQTASKINDAGHLLTNMRNQAENQISSDIAVINAQLKSIADLNNRIESLSAGGNSVADLEDQRDEAIKTLSQYMQITTFVSDTNTIVVMTKQGERLADRTANTLNFQPSNIVATSFYPGGGINPITLEGQDITNSSLGGELGALITLRDKTLPLYAAQMDELAQKLAFRMDQQGLKLFTDLSGNVPANVTSPTPPNYVGFSENIRVNSAVIADPTLIRSGTNGNSVLSGSNEVVRKIALFAFGANAFQQAQGTVDLTSGPTIFAATGMQPTNALIGSVNISSYTPDLVSNPSIPVGAQFDITIGAVTQTITINAGDTAVTLVNNINTAFGSPVASLNGLGQLTLKTNTTITLSDQTLGAAGSAALGLTFGTYPPQNPSFTVQVGTQAPVTISISSTDTPAHLLAALNAIPGLQASLTGTGQLLLVPQEGGDLTLTDGAGQPLVAMGVTIANVPHVAFRKDHLGASGNLEATLLANVTLEAFGRGIITEQSEDGRQAQENAKSAIAYFQALDKRANDISGVNIDQEMADMVRIQSQYSAAAKMLATDQKLLDELLQAI